MARLRPVPVRSGGMLRNLERLGINRGLMGGSRGWFYLGTGLWTVRKVRTLARRQPEILLREVIRPGDRITVANGVATIESVPVDAAQLSRKGRKAIRKLEATPKSRRRRRASKRAVLTHADVKGAARR